MDKRQSLEKGKRRSGHQHERPSRHAENQKVSTIIHNKRLTLLGDIIRTDTNDPLRQVTFENDNLKPLAPALKRVGRPRQKWIEPTTKEAWRRISNEHFIKSEAQMEHIKIQALNRADPF